MISDLLYNPETGKIFRLSLGKYVGTINTSGYYVFTFNHKVYLSHRIAFYLTNLRWPYQIDHINGIRCDNRISNLREVNDLEQSTNKVGWSSTGYKGVTYIKTKNKYQAVVRYKGKRYSLGNFDTAEDAYKSYTKKAQELHGDYFNGKHKSSTLSILPE